jgi:hypothetical protein
MWKSLVSAVVAALAVFVPCLAQADAFDDEMDTMWEVLWHQSGTPTRLVRWEQADIKVRVFGQNVAAHRQHSIQALRDVAAQTGVKVVDVSDRADAAQVADVSIEITPDSSLDEMQPCVTVLKFATETKLDSVSMQMRDKDAFRCAYHESMHVMGVRGHPAGATVLSYFTSQVNGLTPLDKAMLRAWYSPRIHGGMTPFEVLPVLADELVATMPNRTSAALARDRFLSRTVDQMQQFADGQGDVPTIVKRSGKATEQGIRFGRMEMSLFLGIAYREGKTVRQDPGQAAHWLQRAATLGSRSAQAQLAAAGTTITLANR